MSAGIYELWQKGPWDLPRPGKDKDSALVEGLKKEPSRQQLAGAKNIIEKNLFDPERGANTPPGAEGSSVAMQRIRSMVLLGTAILGSSRYAIFQEPTDSRPSVPRAQSAQPGQVRLKLGDMVEGFKLSEIHEKRVVFTRGNSKVELKLDFSRKVEEPKPKATAPTPPRPDAPPRISPPGARGVPGAQAVP